MIESETPKTRVSCYWKDSQIESIAFELNSNGELIGGKMRMIKDNETLESVFVYSNINESIVFSIETKILGR